MGRVQQLKIVTQIESDVDHDFTPSREPTSFNGFQLDLWTSRPIEASGIGEYAGTTIVVLQAGEVNAGAFDSFLELIPVAKRYGVWVHVDGAFGLWAAASPKFRHLLAGVALADSWATGGHKWLTVPHDCGYALVADSESHRVCNWQTSSEDVERVVRAVEKVLKAPD